MKRIYIDTETTGLGPHSHAIIQIAGVIEIDGEIKQSFSYKVQPFFMRDKIEDSALEVNKITRAQLLSFEDPYKVQLRLLNLFSRYVSKFDNKDKFSFVAWRADFDFEFVKAWFEKCGDKYFGSWFFNPPICLMQKAAYALESERHLLPNTFKSTYQIWVFMRQ